MDGKGPEAAERERPDKQQQGTGNGGCGDLHFGCGRCCPCCDRITALLESGAVKRARLDASQRDGGDGNESETVETGRPGEQQQQGAGNDKEPSGDDRQLHARKGGCASLLESGAVKRARLDDSQLSSSGRHYRRRRDDPEWRAAQAAKRAQREHRDDPEWRAAEAAKRAQRKPPKPIDPQRMPTLVKLLDAVLEVEPWNTERHGKNTGRAWAECGERVPAYLKGCRSRPHEFVRQNAFRLVRQLYAPNSHAARTWSPEVKQRVGALADKLTADPRYRDKFTRPTEDPTHGKPGTPQQQQERERREPEGTVANV
ncbi:unnamed protein product [Ectocarpus sp. 13 AM-2016]